MTSVYLGAIALIFIVAAIDLALTIRRSRRLKKVTDAHNETFKSFMNTSANFQFELAKLQDKRKR